jgi:ABC-type sugar transport system ATPase subunit
MPGLDFQVAVVEPMGDEVIVHGSVTAELVNKTDGDAVLMAGENERAAATVRLEPRDRPEEGSVIRLGIDPGDVHLFDAASGDAIHRHTPSYATTKE